jgi:hypothetical protein
MTSVNLLYDFSYPGNPLTGILPLSYRRSGNNSFIYKDMSGVLVLKTPVSYASLRPPQIVS